jgi:hypothetical protein
MASKWWTLALLVVLAACNTDDTGDASSSSPPTATTISSSTATATSTTNPSAATVTTTTVVPVPPLLEIADPQPGAVVTTAVYTFRGVTDPGCTVDVGGKYFADVDVDGNWTLDLVLRPGDNTTTLAATNLAGAKTAAQVTLTFAPFILSADGLGVVSFGDPVGDAVGTLTELLGPASRDRTVESPFEVPEGWSRGDRGPDACHVATTGYICFDYIRFMSWDDAGLWVVLSDLAVEHAANPDDDRSWVEVPPSLQGYSYRGGDGHPLAYTTLGITIGSTVADLGRVYGDAVNFGMGCVDVPEYSVVDSSSADGGRFYGSLNLSHDEPGEWDILESGYVDPASLDPDGSVSSIRAGARSSC